MIINNNRMIILIRISEIFITKFKKKQKHFRRGVFNVKIVRRRDLLTNNQLFCGKQAFLAIKEHKISKLRKIFIRHTVKLSYS